MTRDEEPSMISRQRFVPMLVVGLVVALEAAVPAPPVKLTGAAADAVIKEIQKDRDRKSVV